mmetsp:Transcript_83321/g.162154  ORF Transcript_83321/g.162154 Transcript_83321/m.162154 type:complete len:353 (-) Transcript_83321:153-1211(-)
MWISLAKLLVVLLLFAPKLRYLIRKEKCPWDDSDLNWLQRVVFSSVRDFSRYWHGYELHGLERVKTFERTLLVGYHSRCTLDALYLIFNLQPNAIVSHLLFNLPVIKTALPYMNLISSRATNLDGAEARFTEALVSGKRPLMLLPGGLQEFLKPYSELGNLQWKEVPGFVKVIQQEPLLRSSVKVVPFHTKNSDCCYLNHPWWYETFGKLGERTIAMFKQGKIWVIPVMVTILLFATGFLLLPRGVKLDVYFGEPVVLKEGESAAAFARRINEATQALIDKTETMPQVRREKRGAYSTLVGVLLGFYTFAQNTLIVGLAIGIIWFPVVVACLSARALLYAFSAHFVRSFEPL